MVYEVTKVVSKKVNSLRYQIKEFQAEFEHQKRILGERAYMAEESEETIRERIQKLKADPQERGKNYTYWMHVYEIALTAAQIKKRLNEVKQQISELISDAKRHGYTLT